MGGLVALVPAFRAEPTVAATVGALGTIDGVDEVLVIDDGSDDATAPAARAGGAEVLVLGANRGKGGAVAAGVCCRPDASAYLLVDADTMARGFRVRVYPTIFVVDETGGIVATETHSTDETPEQLIERVKQLVRDELTRIGEGG